MAKITGFRNVIAYDYENTNYEVVHEVLQKRLKDIEGFIEACIIS